MEDKKMKSSSLSNQTEKSILDFLSGKSKNKKFFFVIAGPALIASTAYMDPGNFVTNIQAGSKYGYQLLWVVLIANIVAMLFQSLSAKLGIVTGNNLAELCRDHFSKPIVIIMWIISEISAMATDLAEFLGGAIACSLLFNIPIFWSILITGFVISSLLFLDRYGFRPMELLIGFFVIIVGLCYLVELFIAPVNWKEVGYHLIVPNIPDSNAFLISVGIIGATVMPHALYLHSGLTQNRIKNLNDKERIKIIRYSNYEIIIVLAIVGSINIAILIMSSSAFYHGHNEIFEIEAAYHMLTPILGSLSATFFLISLLVSGISSSVVGTISGQIIMQGFTNYNIPIWIRRLTTMIPAFLVILLGINTIDALVFSQIILSISLPVPMMSLIFFTGRKKTMGIFSNTTGIQYISIILAIGVILMNFILLAFIMKISF